MTYCLGLKASLEAVWYFFCQHLKYLSPELSRVCPWDKVVLGIAWQLVRCKFWGSPSDTLYWQLRGWGQAVRAFISPQVILMPPEVWTHFPRLAVLLNQDHPLGFSRWPIWMVKFIVRKYVGRFQGSGDREVRSGDGELVFNGDSFSLGRGRIRELDDGENCFIMWMYLVPLNCTVEYG